MIRRKKKNPRKKNSNLLWFQFTDITANLVLINWLLLRTGHLWYFFNAKQWASSSAKNSPQEASGKEAILLRILKETELCKSYFRISLRESLLWPLQLPFVLKQPLNSSPSTYIPSKFTIVTHYEFTNISQHKSVSHHIF